MESQQQPRKGKSVEKVRREKPELHSSGSAHGLAESASFSLNYKHYHRYYAHIEKKFCEKLELSAGDKVQLQDPSGEVWPVGIISGDRQAGLRFGAGWTHFVKRNWVVVGDRLEFCYKAELGLIQVKIDRKVDRKEKQQQPRKAESASFSLDYKQYKKYFVRIPMKFYEKLELSSGDKVQLQDPSGEVWSVGIFSGHQQAGPRFCAGWNRFVRRNRVVVGDRLEFCYKAELGLIQVKIDRKEKNMVMASNVKIEEEEEEEEDDVVLID